MYQPLDRSKPYPYKLKPTETYLGEDEHGYYVMDGFFDGVANMFKRMVKFTPKSFTPSNIFKAVRNTTLTTMTGGVYLALPKNIKKTMENVANVALPVVAGAVAAVTLGPAVMGVVGPKLSMVAGALGKNISTVGKGLFDMLGRLPANKQSQIAQQVTPQDILYSEQNNGQFPPRIMQLIDEADKQTYGYAVQNAMLPASSSSPMPDTTSYYADSSLYPGLQQYNSDLYQQQQQQQDQSGSVSIDSGTLVALLGGASLFAFLVGRK